MTEIRVFDTYWSDHCRHTTFLTELKNIEFEEGYYSEPIKAAFKNYTADRESFIRIVMTSTFHLWILQLLR